MENFGWVVVALGALGCLGGAPAKPATPEGQLQEAKTAAASARWPEAREAAIAYWVKYCRQAPSSPSDCASAQLIRGDAELAGGSPETALLAFKWVLGSGDAAAQQQAEQGIARATSELQKVLDSNVDSTWLVVQQDFDDNHKFGPERALYTLDGTNLGQVTRPSTFEERQHRVLAQKIASGPRRLAVEIHWKGLGTFDNYLWSSFNPIELEAPLGGVLVASLDVTYTDGGPSNNSVKQDFRITKLP